MTVAWSPWQQSWGWCRESCAPEPYLDRLKALAKVVDGDTLDLDLDLGFSLVLRQGVRLLGLDAPEIRSKDPAEKARGLESQAFVSQWFSRPGEVLVRTSLCSELLERGLARPYNP